MKLQKKTDGNTTTYFEKYIKKYKHHKESSGFELWREYDESGNAIHYKDSNGLELWKEYDESGNEIHCKESDGYERWSEYDESGNEIHYEDSGGTEWWSDDNPENPKNQENTLIEVEVEPFIFSTDDK